MDGQVDLRGCAVIRNSSTAVMRSKVREDMYFNLFHKPYLLISCIRLGFVCLFNHVFGSTEHKQLRSWTGTGLVPSNTNISLHTSLLFCEGLQVSGGHLLLSCTFICRILFIVQPVKWSRGSNSIFWQYDFDEFTAYD